VYSPNTPDGFQLPVICTLSGNTSALGEFEPIGGCLFQQLVFGQADRAKGDTD